jgi:hypothetical protein
MKAQRILGLLLFMLTLAAPVQGEMSELMGSSAADFRCHVRATKASGGVRLEAVVSGETSTSGEYEFEVRKSGGGNTSATSQGGTFEIDNEEAILGEVTLGGGGTSTAELKIRWESGGTCEARYPG